MIKFQPVLLSLSITALIAATGCSPGAQSSVPASARAVQDSCNEYQSVGRAAAGSARATQNDLDCDGETGTPQGTGWNTAIGEPGFDFASSDGDQFYGSQDQYGNPCAKGAPGGFAVIGCTSSRNMWPFYSPIATNPAPLGPIATLGGPAQRGDNCSGASGLSVGLPLPGAAQNSNNGQPLGSDNNTATVSNQSQVSVTSGGSTQVIGFVIGTKGDGNFFVPNITVAVGIGVVSIATASAPIYPLPSPNVNSPTDVAAITAAINSVAASYNASVPAWLKSVLATAAGNTPQFKNTNCFSVGLPRLG